MTESELEVEEVNAVDVVQDTVKPRAYDLSEKKGVTRTKSAKIGRIGGGKR